MLVNMDLHAVGTDVGQQAPSAAAVQRPGHRQRTKRKDNVRILRVHANGHVIPALPHIDANIGSVQIIPSAAAVGGFVYTQEAAEIRARGVLNTNIEGTSSGRSDSDFNSPNVRGRQRIRSGAGELLKGLPAIGGAEDAVQRTSIDVS